MLTISTTIIVYKLKKMIKMNPAFVLGFAFFSPVIIIYKRGMQIFTYPVWISTLPYSELLSCQLFLKKKRKPHVSKAVTDGKKSKPKKNHKNKTKQN